MQNDFRETLRERVLIFDGAMGTSIQDRGLSVDDFEGQEGCNEILVLSRPQVIREIHARFLEVGCDAIETNTFGASRLVLGEYGLGERAYEINRTAARLAREVAASYSSPEQPRFVVGAMGPGTRLPSLGQIAFDDLVAMYREQARGLIDGGADVLLVETCQDLLQAKAGVIACQDAMTAAGTPRPLMVQVTLEPTGTMLLGTELGAALTALDRYDLDAIGLNCATGPQEMMEHVHFLSRHSRKAISCLPNAGLPHMEGGRACYLLTPDELADFHRHFVEQHGVSIVGGCCGTTPAHLKRVVEVIGRRAPTRRTPEHIPAASSLYSSVPFRQDRSILIVGERTNANGSKQFRERLLAGDADGMVAVARDQVKEGAHVLDVCVDYVGRDGVADMADLVGRLATQCTIPLVIDSTEAPVIEAALKRIGGRAIINSVNLEDGEAGRPAKIFSMARRYGAAVIGLLIDEEGQARSVEWKLRVAHRLHDLAVHRYGLEPSDLIFDALTFPVGSGQEDLRKDGLATLEAIRRIKAELPGVYTVLGVSNVSFGLKPAARQVLNSVFLHLAVEAGLDAAIVNAAKILPMNRIEPRQREVARQLIHDERRDGYDPLTEFMRLFENRRRHSGCRGSGGASEPRGAPEGADRGRGAPRAGRAAGRGAGRVRRAHDHQRDPAGRHEDGRGAVRQRPDATPVRAAVGRGHEGGGRLPRAIHDPFRRADQGEDRPGDGQGGRPRHRQEPGGHHPDQQRLHRDQPRDQAADPQHRRGGAEGAGGRHRHERAPGEVHPRHAGQPGGTECPGALAIPGDPGRRGPDAWLRGGGSAGRLSGGRVLRRGRLRRAAADGGDHLARSGRRAGGPGHGQAATRALCRPRRRCGSHDRRARSQGAATFGAMSHPRPPHFSGLAW